jgi:hypothetical protein
MEIIMNEKELIKKLNSVGKEKFITYYHLFEDYYNGKISRYDCIEKLVSDGASNESGAAIRCGNAKLIFDANMEKLALEIIVNSNRLSYVTSNKAKEILEKDNF